MKLQVLLSAFAALSILFANASAGSLHHGRRITLPPPMKDTGIKRIPDRAHPFRRPRRYDLRGPCPGLNTLANHGYLPRNGIATFEEIVNAVQEGFNMPYEIALGATAFGMLSRGNAYTNQLSIGGPSRFIPPLPHNLDGNLTKGLATHGRFEGDVSLTRLDFYNGDNVNFSQELFDQFLDEIAIHGNDSEVTGPKSIVSLEAMGEFKYKRFLDSQAQNPSLELHAGRWLFTFGEAAFVMNFFPNGTDNTLSIPTLTSFFRDQRFPPDWYRHDGPPNLGPAFSAVLNAHPILPGSNVNGEYVEEPLGDCDSYTDLVGRSLSRTLLDSRGILRDNVDLLLDAVGSFFGDCPRVDPFGEPGV